MGHRCDVLIVGAGIAGLTAAFVATVQPGKAAGIVGTNKILARSYLERDATFAAVDADVTILAHGAEWLADRFGAKAQATCSTVC